MMAISKFKAEELACRILAASDAAASISPITEADPAFSLADAYSVAAEVISRRMARGEQPVGWKIGFTNRTIWNEYGVHGPIWGPMYDSTLRRIEPSREPIGVDLGGLVEPRIEPEIVLRIARPPGPGMDARALLDCIDAVGHGFELVQSLFPGWRFAAADTVAAFALHGRYCCGPLSPIAAADRAHWLSMLEEFEIALSKDGTEIDRGVAANVLDGPVHALGHLVRGLAEHPLPISIRPGDLITTGTVTRAFPVRPGERWSTDIAGLPVAGLSVQFT